MKTHMRFLAVFSALIMLLSCVGCSAETETAEAKEKLVVWVHSQQTAELMSGVFLSDNPGIEWELDIKAVDSGNLYDEYLEAEAEGKLPDVILLSPDNLGKFLDSGKLADLIVSGLEPNPERYYSYAYNMGFDSSNVLRAMCWQADPTLFFYRRSIAKYYFGTDEPAEIEKKLSTTDSFMETARALKDSSGGKTKIVAGTQDLLNVYLSADTNGWTDDLGSLIIGSTAESFLDLAAQMEKEDLTWGAEQYSQAWLSGISDGQSVFGYFTSGIGLDSILKKACGGSVSGEGTFGDWAAVPGFSGCNLGGCWMAMSETSTHKDEALYFISYFTCETEAMKKYFLASGDFCANSIVSEQIQYDPQFTESFLGGQNYYSLLTESAERIPVKKIGKYDSMINAAFSDCVQAYSQEYKSREQAIEDFRTTVNQIIAQ